jgi:hypothetical protein
MDFVPRILLGLRQTEPGGRSFVCSPQPHGLTSAKGGRMTPFGPVRIEWRIEGGSCRVFISAPPEVEVKLESNRHLGKLELSLSKGRARPDNA